MFIEYNYHSRSLLKCRIHGFTSRYSDPWSLGFEQGSPFLRSNPSDYCRSSGDYILKTLKKCQNKHTTSENSQLEKQYSYSSRCAHLDVINLFSILLSLILEEKILFSLCTIFPYYVFFAWIETLMLTFKNSHILLWFIKNKGKL